MNDYLGNNIIDLLVNDLNATTRKSKGRDTSKNYHKITISVSEEDKKSIMKFAETQGVSVSLLIKNLLREKNIISK